MFNRILVPLDGSSLAECVLPHAIALAKAFQAQLTVMTAVEPDSYADTAGAVDSFEWQFRKVEADVYLEEVANRLVQAGVAVGKAVLEGQAAERIVEFAHDEAADLILLSSHGKSGLSTWNVSSIVQKVIQRAYVPVMIVRAYRAEDMGLDGLRYRRLLIPLDGSARAECVLPQAVALAQLHEAELVLAHVVHRPEVPHHMPLSEDEVSLIDQLVSRNRERGAHYLAEILQRFYPTGRTVLLEGGNAPAALHNLVSQEQVDLVLLSAHGYTGQTMWPYGSVALNFIVYGTTPLLIVQDVPREEMQRTQAEAAVRESIGH